MAGSFSVYFSLYISIYIDLDIFCKRMIMNPISPEFLAFITDVIIGMPHRGRLNVLSTVIRKPMEQILNEFQGMLRRTSVYAIQECCFGVSHSIMSRMQPAYIHLFLSLSATLA